MTPGIRVMPLKFTPRDTVLNAPDEKGVINTTGGKASNAPFCLFLKHIYFLKSVKFERSSTWLYSRSYWGESRIIEPSTCLALHANFNKFTYAKFVWKMTKIVTLFLTSYFVAWVYCFHKYMEICMYKGKLEGIKPKKSEPSSTWLSSGVHPAAKAGTGEHDESEVSTKFIRKYYTVQCHTIIQQNHQGIHETHNDVTSIHFFKVFLPPGDVQNQGGKISKSLVWEGQKRDFYM